MDRITVSEAESGIAELIDRASRGEEFEIVRQGRPVARLAPAKALIPPADRQPFDWDALREMTSRMTPQTESAGEFIRKMRDSDRY